MQHSTTTLFTCVSTERDRDNDTQSWTFEPTIKALRRSPSLAGVTVRIFNT